MDVMGWWVGLDGLEPVRHVSKTYERQMDDRGGAGLFVARAKDVVTWVR